MIAATTIVQNTSITNAIAIQAPGPHPSCHLVITRDYLLPARLPETGFGNQGPRALRGAPDRHTTHHQRHVRETPNRPRTSDAGQLPKRT